MNNKVKLSQASMIVTLGILLTLITAYVPMLSLLSLVIPVPYAIIGTLTDNKYSILSLVATFFILILCVNPIYALKICIISVLPGIAIGSIARGNLKSEEYNKFEPIYIGTIVAVLSFIIFYFTCNVILGVDILDNLMKVIKETMGSQIEILKSSGLNLKDDISAEYFTDFISNMIPAMLFLQGIILAFITYYLEIFILKRVRKTNLETPKFTDFYLPGNAITITFMLYLLVLILDIIGAGLHTEIIMMNLQLVFTFMFMIQGIGVCVHYFRACLKKHESKKVLISGLILYIFGFMGISFVGMLDSIIDFRKIRNYKSI